MINTDVIIVGGGPAGASCAWELKKHGVDFLLLEKATFPRSKTCAGWITPQVMHNVQLDPAAYTGNFSTFHRFTIEIKQVRFELPTLQHAIRRVEFDAWLIDRVKEQVLQHLVAEIREEGGFYLVDGKYQARYLIGAGGTHCPVKRALFTDSEPSQHGTLIIAQEEEFSYAGASDRCHLWFLQDGLPGYAWYFPKNDGVVNVGVGGAAARLKKNNQTLKYHWKILEEKLERYGLVRERSYQPVGYSYYLRARSPMLRVGNAMLIGDALGLSTLDMGEGIGPAIQSGINAAQAIIQKKPYRLSNIPRFSFPSLLQLRLHL